MEDIEIARNTELKEISEITDELNIPNKYLIDIEQFVKNVNLKIILIL